nr:DUF2993 domain-containing protein [Actinopolyspora biskrensis]
MLAADFGTAAVAENQVSKKMGDKLGLARDPAVRINGFPFLTQAIRGDFRDVRLRAPGVDMGPVEDVDLQADLHHARVSTFAMLNGDSSRIDVDEVVGRLRLDDASLGGVLPVDDLRIAPAGDSAGGTANSSDSSGRASTGVRLEGTVDIAGSTNKVAVTGQLVLNDEGGIRIEPRELDLDNSRVGSVDLASRFEQAILRRFTTTLDPGMLPFTVRPTALHVEPGALVLEGTARNVTVNGDGTVN